MTKIALAGIVSLSLLISACTTTSSPLDLVTGGATRVSDQGQVAAILQDVHEGMERQRIYKVMAHVSPAYYDEAGRDYAAIQEYLKTVFQQYDVIRINRTAPRIVVEGDTARALESFGTVAETSDPSLGTEISLQGHVVVYFEKNAGIWQIVRWGVMR